MSHTQTCGTWEAQTPAQNSQEHPAWQLERVVVPETSMLQATLAPHSLPHVPVPQNVCSQLPQGALNLQGGGAIVVTLGGPALGVVLL